MSESGEFPKPTDNDDELVHVYIKSELDKVGININRIGTDSTDRTVVTVITDKDVPKTTKSNTRLYAADKGMTIDFQTAPSGR